MQVLRWQQPSQFSGYFIILSTPKVSFYGKATNLIYIQAKIDNITSNVINIDDVYNYDPLTSNSGKWTIPSGVSSTYSSDGWNISANAYKQIKLTDKLTTDCSVEFTLVDYNITSYGGSAVICIYTNGETTPSLIILDSRSSMYSSSTCLGVDIGHRLIKGAVYKTEFTTSIIKVYENDVLIAQTANDIGFPTRFEFHMGANGRYAVYKDLKVRTL